MLFGIGMNTDHTLEEVGAASARVTCERIGQIEAKAIRESWGYPSQSRQLRSFLDN